MGMQTQIPRPRAEMSPRVGSVNQHRGSVEDEKHPEADANQQQPRFTIFRQESQPHGATMNRSVGQRKQTPV